MDGRDMRNTISGKKTASSSNTTSSNSRKVKKTNLLSKENVNVMNTPIWTSPKRSTSSNKTNSVL